jgi:(+)-pinoresinol hydroxylase
MSGGGGGRSRAIAASAVLAVVLGGGALLWSRGTPQSVPAAKPVRTAGGKIYDKWCSDCHSTPGGSGTMALQRKYAGSPPAILDLRNDMNADYVKLVVRQGISFMPTFRKTEISDAELELLAAYVIHQPETGKTASVNPTSSQAK